MARWKEKILSAYRAVESQEHWWHLPDGRTMRVVANPHPNGGVTWVFENLTEKIDLESRYNTRRCAFRARRWTIWPRASPCSVQTAVRAVQPGLCKALGA
jgi:hypothetical protein